MSKNQSSEFQHVNCLVYAGLHDGDALKLAYEHNLTNEQGMSTSAEDVLYLFRQKLCCVLQEKSIFEIVHILSLSTSTARHYTISVNHIAVSRTSDDVWTLIEEMLKLWQKRKFTNMPRGVPKPVHLKSFSSVLSEKSPKHLLKDLLTNKDWALFKAACNRYVKHKMYSEYIYIQYY